jgi:ribosome-associated protein
LESNQAAEDTTLQVHETILEAVQEAKGRQIVRFDVRGRSSLSDYVIICEGRSQAHCRGIAERVEMHLKQSGEVYPLGKEGARDGNWILMDYAEAVLHVFHPEIRKYYNLEELHQECPAERWDDEA